MKPENPRSVLLSSPMENKTNLNVWAIGIVCCSGVLWQQFNIWTTKVVATYKNSLNASAPNLIKSIDSLPAL